MIFSRLWKKHEGVRNLSSIKISYDKNISAPAVQELYALVGWVRREPELIQRSLQNSIAVVTAWDGESLIGFARATGDGVFNATVWDVAVHPDHQGVGVGQLVMHALLEELDRTKVLLVTLLAEQGQERFYKKFGFITDPSNLRGMVRERS